MTQGKNSQDHNIKIMNASVDALLNRAYPHPILQRFLAELIIRTSGENKKDDKKRMNSALKAIFGEPYVHAEITELGEVFDDLFDLVFLHGVFLAEGGELKNCCRMVIRDTKYPELSDADPDPDNLEIDAKNMAARYNYNLEKIKELFSDQRDHDYFQIYIEHKNWGKYIAPYTINDLGKVEAWLLQVMPVFEKMKSQPKSEK